MSAGRKHIPAQYLLDYEQFRQDLDPFNILNELARCRTLLCQFQDSLQANKEEARDAFLQVAGENFKSQLEVEGLEDTYIDSIMGLANNSYSSVYDAIFQPLSRMTYREAEAMTKILKTTAEIAEKYHNIQDGVTVKIDYNNQKLVQAMIQFIMKIIMPNIPIQLRPQIALAARNFFPALSGEVLDVA